MNKLDFWKTITISLYAQLVVILKFNAEIPKIITFQRLFKIRFVLSSKKTVEI